MAALQCEICGGKLIGKPGGVFECDSCGMEYSTEWAKAKVQEIKGTVKIEGPVEVTGTVKVEGGPSVENLLKRGNTLLSDQKWKDAEKYFNQVLELETENAEAYLGLAMVSCKIPTRERFATSYIDGKVTKYGDTSKTLLRVKQFARGELKDWLNDIEERKCQKEEKLRREEAEWHRDEAERQQRIPFLAEKRKKLALTAGMLTIHAGLRADGTVVCATRNEDTQRDVSSWRNIVAIAAGTAYIVGLRADGTVVATGLNTYNECDVSGWRNITAVATGSRHTVGLRADGTVVATGLNTHNECDVSDWKDIVAVTAGNDFTLGLRSNGTVVATGNNEYDRLKVSVWQRVTSVAVGSIHTVGLRADGTVVSTRNNIIRPLDVSGWRDIVAVAAAMHAVGLRADGAVVATGYNKDGQCEVAGWRDIVSVAVNSDYTVGLRADGTVVLAGKIGNYDIKEKVFHDNTASVSSILSGWRDIVAVYPGGSRIVGLRADGTVVDTDNAIQGWKLFNSIDTLEQKRAEVKKIVALNSEKQSLQTELSNLKGLFSGGKRKELEARLAQLERELSAL